VHPRSESFPEKRRKGEREKRRKGEKEKRQGKLKGEKNAPY